MSSLTDVRSSEWKLERWTLLQLCDLVSSPLSEEIKKLAKADDWMGYLKLEVKPSDYSDPQKFADDWLLVKLLSKSPNIPVEADPELEALTSFVDGEISCLATNVRLRDRARHPTKPEHRKFDRVIFDAQTLIAKVLPELTQEELGKIADGFGHGPGGTTGVRGVGTCAVHKYEERMHLTANLTPFLSTMMGNPWELNLLCKFPKGPKIVPGARFTTVPKKALTHRGINVEPTANVFGQKGIGRRIRRRLSLFGLNLDTQAVKNRLLAKLARLRKLATIDLKNASDCNALELVRLLCPRDWTRLLMVFRSPKVKFLGQYRPLQKISAMGNGYTFELESLIFWAICKSVVPARYHDDIGVFGDDIIVPQDFAEEVVETLNYLGFEVNASKSFLAGDFFESCGTDFFKGEAVRPIYLKGRPEDGTPYEVTIANRIRHYAKMRGYDLFCDSRFKPTWDALRSVCPSKWKVRIVPASVGDIGLTGAESECFRFKCPKGYLEGRYIETMQNRVIKVDFDGFGVLLDKLTQAGTGANVAQVLKAPKPPSKENGSIPADKTEGEQPSEMHPGNGYALRKLPSYEFRPRWTLIQEWSSGFEWV